jgi:hypothetical protein
MRAKLSRRDIARSILAAGSAFIIGNKGARHAEVFANDCFQIDCLEPVDLTPEAEAWMTMPFEKQADITRRNIVNFREWIEKGGAEDFHATFAPIRSEIRQAMIYNLTPPELTTDIAGAVRGKGPYYYPADVTQGEIVAGNFFGRVALARLGSGQEFNERTITGGEADAVIFGFTVHDYQSEAGAEGKVIVLHYGGVNESEVWTAAGFYNYFFPKGEFLSPAVTFRVDSGEDETERVWPYDIPGKPRIPQHYHAGINEVIRSISEHGMASIRLGTTVNLDWFEENVVNQTPSYLYRLIPSEFQGERYAFGVVSLGQNILARLQAHAVYAMIQEWEKSGRIPAVVQPSQNGLQIYAGVEELSRLFPDATDKKRWPRITPSSYYFDRPRLELDDIYGKLPFVSPKRFSYPPEVPSEFERISTSVA